MSMEMSMTVVPVPVRCGRRLPMKCLPLKSTRPCTVPTCRGGAVKTAKAATGSSSTAIMTHLRVGRSTEEVVIQPLPQKPLSLLRTSYYCSFFRYLQIPRDKSSKKFAEHTRLLASLAQIHLAVRRMARLCIAKTKNRRQWDLSERH